MNRTSSRAVLVLLAAAIMGTANVSVAENFDADSKHQLPKPDGKPGNHGKPIQVYVMLGQSNMLGFGRVWPKETKGLLEFMVKDNGKYPHLVDDAGNWTTRQDVRYVHVMDQRGVDYRDMEKFGDIRNEWLTPNKSFGPALGFGYVMGHFHDEPVVLLKACIGNRSLGWDLLPPGSERFEYEGTRALKLLETRLVAITVVVPEKSLAKLRTITIQMDFDYGDLRAMQYHPDAGWLKEHGYSEQLSKCVHIPEIEDFLEPEGIHGQPWGVLHELAHGFHDQIIGFDDLHVIAAWKEFRDSGKYKSVLTASGKMYEHYGVTDAKELFSDMIECYFGSNDFYPFFAGELKQADPEIFALFADIWGPLPGMAPAK